MATISKNVEDNYRVFLTMEKSMSENTVVAYIRDLHTLSEYLDGIGIDYRQATLTDLKNLIVELTDIGISERSRARMISGIRNGAVLAKSSLFTFAIGNAIKGQKVKVKIKSKTYTLTTNAYSVDRKSVV